MTSCNAGNPWAAPGPAERNALAVKERMTALLAQKERIIVAIDGSCGAGKTTLAEALAGLFDCNVFHMDDFFLRPEQRTPQRFAEVGGNVDYARFQEEVLAPLLRDVPFSYRPFDCGSLLLGDRIAVTPKRVNIIEGTYSLHPYLGDRYDLRIFLSATPELQRKRILRRPAALHSRFFREWIPMEQRYFDGFDIPHKCDLLLRSPDDPFKE